MKKNIALFEIEASKVSDNPAWDTQDFFWYSNSCLRIITTMLVNPKINNAKYPGILENTLEKPLKNPGKMKRLTSRHPVRKQTGCTDSEKISYFHYNRILFTLHLQGVYWEVSSFFQGFSRVFPGYFSEIPGYLALLI